MLKFTYWAPRGGTAGMGRVYINGLPGKAYLQPSRNGTRLVLEDGGDADATQRQVIGTLIAMGLAPVLAERLDWKAVLDLVASAKPSPRPAPSGFARSRERLEERLVEHNMRVESIQVEAPFELRVDEREPQQIVDQLRRCPMANVVITSLEVGDYIIEANDKTIVVERKTLVDFQQSVQHGRMFDQAQRIGQLGEAVWGVVVLEGETLGGAGITMLPQSVTGAITCLGLIQGCMVLQTLDFLHTSYALIKLAHHCTGLGYALPVHREKPTALLDARTYVLQALPGVSAELATRLLDHLGSVERVMTATRAALLAVPGVGPKTADRIRAVVADG
jgi:ERCC4-type nuclease